MIGDGGIPERGGRAIPSPQPPPTRARGGLRRGGIRPLAADSTERASSDRRRRVARPPVRRRGRCGSRARTARRARDADSVTRAEPPRRIDPPAPADSGHVSRGSGSDRDLVCSQRIDPGALDPGSRVKSFPSAGGVSRGQSSYSPTFRTAKRRGAHKIRSCGNARRLRPRHSRARGSASRWVASASPSRGSSSRRPRRSSATRRAPGRSPRTPARISASSRPCTAGASSSAGRPGARPRRTRARRSPPRRACRRARGTASG